MADFREDTQYFYCPDYKKYVKCHKGIFYNIKDGVEMQNDFYDKILIGDIYTEDITKEEYYKHMN
ncbi:hypothetical protein [Peptoanaerobacter stomatis]|uniref:hypothetical protein n=1 Tax=Peptoanaerobacter stomatis TaxID=796937 RepID=UPI003F9FD287